MPALPPANAPDREKGRFLARAAKNRPYDKKLSLKRDSKLRRNPIEERMLLATRDRRLRTAVKHGWTRLVTAARPRYRFSLRRRGRLVTAGAPLPEPPATIDPVALTVLAVNRLGPATLRTVANGKPLTVTVPDAHVGAIFRAALAEMQKTRFTDRLIDVVIAGETASAGRAAPNA
jgi:hypothetical protein